MLSKGHCNENVIGMFSDSSPIISRQDIDEVIWVRFDAIYFDSLKSLCDYVTSNIVPSKTLNINTIQIAK